jgi:hypothetical protein
MSDNVPRTKVPVAVTNEASWASYTEKLGLGKFNTNERAYQRYGNNQDGNHNIETHEKAVQATNSAIEVAHRMLDRQLLPMELSKTGGKP